MYLGAVAGDVVDLTVDEAQRAVRRMLPGDGSEVHDRKVRVKVRREAGQDLSDGGAQWVEATSEPSPGTW